MSKARALLKKLRETKKVTGVTSTPYTYLTDEEKLALNKKKEKENEIDPLLFLNNHAMVIQPENIENYLKIDNKDNNDKEEESEENEEKKDIQKNPSFILKIQNKMPTISEDLTNVANDKPINNDSFVDNNFEEIKANEKEKENEDLVNIEEEKEYEPPKTYREKHINMNRYNKMHHSDKNCKSNLPPKLACHDGYKTSRVTKIKDNGLIQNKSFIQKIKPSKKSNFQIPKLTKSLQSYQSLTIKQRSLNLLRSAKKLNEINQKPTKIPKKLSLPELTEEQKIKFEVRMRKIKKKKMFTSRITSKGVEISKKIEDLCKKFEHNLAMRSLIDSVVSIAEFPENSVFDEDIGNNTNDFQIKSSTLKRVNSEELLTTFRKE